MTPSGQRLLDRFRAGPYSDLAMAVRKIEDEARARTIVTTGSAPCPGYKRSCGVWSPRPRCFYCVKSQALDQKENR